MSVMLTARMTVSEDKAKEAQQAIELALRDVAAKFGDKAQFNEVRNWEERFRWPTPDAGSEDEESLDNCAMCDTIGLPPDDGEW